MPLTTPAILISSLKYGENSRIFRCYTRSLGLRSFIVRRSLSGKQKNTSLFNPLNQLEITFRDRNGRDLQYILEASAIRPYASLYDNPIKSGILFFLAEILQSVLKEEEADEELYDFIAAALRSFDEKEKAYSDFHLWFLSRLSLYLGFYPNLTAGANYFNLPDGRSTDSPTSDFYIEKDTLKLFEKLYQHQFTEESPNVFSREERKALLDLMMKYYTLHSSGFRKPKSLEVLSVIFE